jgi:hypothetical protein
MIQKYNGREISSRKGSIKEDPTVLAEVFGSSGGRRIKLCFCFSYTAKLCFNGQQYLKWHLQQRGIDYQVLDNGNSGSKDLPSDGPFNAQNDKKQKTCFRSIVHFALYPDFCLEAHLLCAYPSGVLRTFVVRFPSPPDAGLFQASLGPGYRSIVACRGPFSE